LIVGDAGRSAEACGICFADAAETLLALPAEQARATAGARAADFDWARTVGGFLAMHGLAPHASVAA
jgi:hypothetical protein